MSETHERLYLKSNPKQMGNEEFISQYLDGLLDQYSTERLTGLSETQLQAEAAYARQDFKILRAHFPSSTSQFEDKHLRQVMKQNDFRDLDSLTHEQRQEINWTMNRVERNIDRAYQNAERRKRELRGRIGRGILNLVDSVTRPFSPNVSIQFPVSSSKED